MESRKDNASLREARVLRASLSVRLIKWVFVPLGREMESVVWLEDWRYELVEVWDEEAVRGSRFGSCCNESEEEPGGKGGGGDWGRC